MKQGWEEKRLGDVSAVSAGNSAPQKKELFKNGIYPFIRTSDVGKIREVEFKCGQQYAESNMISFLETSAKDGSGVDKAFLKILSIISSEFQYEEEIQNEEEPTIDSTYSYCTCL